MLKLTTFWVRGLSAKDQQEKIQQAAPQQLPLSCPLFLPHFALITNAYAFDVPIKIPLVLSLHIQLA